LRERSGRTGVLACAAIMLAGLPLTTWALFVVAVGLGLGVELRFYLAHRRRGRARAESPEPPASG